MITGIASIGVAVPPCSITQSQADSYIEKYYSNELHRRSLEIFHKVLRHPSIEKRHIAVEQTDALPDLKNEDPDTRIERFIRWSRLLGGEAIKSALAKRNLATTDIDALIVNTCTGYICPGLSTYLIEDLGLSSKIQAYDLVGTGCGGALPNLQLASQFCTSHPGAVAVSISIEICTATFQMGNDTSLIISNSIFGDGAAAAVVWDRPAGVSLIASDQCFLPEFRNDVRYVHKGGQLHNKLSKRLPGIIGERTAILVKELLNKNNLSQDKIDHYFIHPGGDKVLDSCALSLRLDDEKMKMSRSILLEYGNMSSPTILFELDRMYDQIKKDQWCLMLAFGAGMSIYGWLLKGN